MFRGEAGGAATFGSKNGRRYAKVVVTLVRGLYRPVFMYTVQWINTYTIMINIYYLVI